MACVIGGAVVQERSLAGDLEVGTRFRDCPTCPEMIVVPAGSFLMGSPSHEKGGGDDEGPPHDATIDEGPLRDVTIAVPFAVGVYEVTVGEFKRFVRATGHSTGNSCWAYGEDGWKDRSGFGWRNPGFGQGQQHPVTCVGWSDAQAFVSWLSRKTGEEYRLPSEAEWETVARIGVEWKCTHANAADASLKERYLDWPWPVASCRDGYVHTAPVGSFSPGGRIGLDDMQGNVWEWAADCWNASHEGAPSDGSAWEDGDCSRRVLRGGSWTNGPRPWTVTLRNMDLIGIRVSTYGFRVARTLEQ